MFLKIHKTFKVLVEHHLEFLSLTGGCTGLSESTLVKMSHCWKSHVPAQKVMRYLPSLVCVLHILVHCMSSHRSCTYAIHTHTQSFIQICLRKLLRFIQICLKDYCIFF